MGSLIQSSVLCTRLTSALLTWDICSLGCVAPRAFHQYGTTILFPVTVATMLCGTGRLQILVIHGANLVTGFVKHSALLLYLLQFLGAEDFSSSGFVITSAMAVLLAAHSQTSLGQHFLILTSHLNKLAGKKWGEKSTERDWRISCAPAWSQTIPSKFLFCKDLWTFST